ncbi:MULTISPECIES: hypothetical protein [unclassified Halomonas]|uniref:hypothetical protein n=1 Tax=unclassified Halomonas TaxID=2609666 RepID=UPI0020769BFC|nr:MULTISPECIES: hypothetical protein [unclassified Halomonas]
MQVQRNSSKRSAWMYWSAAALLGVSTLANASSQAFEGDLRERLSRDGGEVTFSRVYEDAEQGTHVAEDIAAQRPDGTSVSIGRYTVEGDYDAPAAISLQDVVLNDPAIGEDGVTLETLRIVHPEHAVRFLSVLDEPDFRFDDIEATGFRMSVPNQSFGDGPFNVSAQNIVIDALRASGVTQQGVEQLNAHGIESHIILDSQSGSATELSIETLGLQDFEWPSQHVDHMGNFEVGQMQLDSELWHVGFDRLWLDGDPFDGAMGVYGGFADLRPWLEQLPAREGEQLSMVYNAFVGERDQLHFSIEHHSSLGEGNKRVLDTAGNILIPGAGRVEYDLGARLQLADGIEPNFVLDDNQYLDLAQINGGNASLTYDDEGLLPRILQLLSDSLGISTEEALRLHRRDFMLIAEEAAPGIDEILLAMLTLMQEDAERMTIDMIFPKGILVSEWLMGPHYWNERYDISVELE